MKLKLSQTLFTCSLLGLAACGEPMSEEELQVIESKEVGQVAQLLRKPSAVPGEYIVVFRDELKGEAARDVAGAARELAGAHGGQVLHTYQHALKGFAVRLPEARVQQLLADLRVAYVEENGRVQVVGTQSSATWGIDRIDQQSLPLNSTYNYNVDGTGVHAYIIDTGIRLTHSQFTGRMGNGFDAITSGGNANDCQGHGTHVAGTVAGTTWGVAKKATVHPVRVLDCQGSGTDAQVIAGIDWVRANHVKPAVANMSLGGGASQALDDSVASLISAGVATAVAAGNDNSNACNYSPARAPTAITVGSTTSTDARSSFSNYGTCLDIYAPGSSITSASYSSDTGSTSMSGTSMASPHVAGAAALYLGANPTATPQQVRDALVNNGTTGKVTSAGTGSPNVLLYTGFIGSGGGGGGGGTTCGTTEQLLLNPGFESGNVSWTTTSGVIDGTTSGSAPRTGSYKAWLNGYGSARTDTTYQQLTIPSTACTASLSFWVKITTSETTTTTAYDKLSVQILDGAGTLKATLATYSNLNKSTGYVQKTFDLAAYKGQTIRVYFKGVEDSSAATSFFLDDTALTITR